MRSHLRPNANNKRSLRKAAEINRRSVEPAKEEQRLNTDYDPDPALKQTPLKHPATPKHH